MDSQKLRVNANPTGYLTGVSGLVDQIGHHGFDDALLATFREIGQFEHVLVYEISSDRPVEILALSSTHRSVVESASSTFLDRHVAHDPLLPQIRSAISHAGSNIFRADVQAMPHRHLYDLIYGPGSIRERIILSGQVFGKQLAASLVRPGYLGLLEQVAADRMLAISPVLFSIIAKHRQFETQSRPATSAYASLKAIESDLCASGADLTERQVQVCSRILYGISTAGIALDLGLSEETIVTHRKHAYQRLNISSRFELNRWYLAHCHGSASVPDDNDQEMPKRSARPMIFHPSARLFRK